MAGIVHCRLWAPLGVHLILATQRPTGVISPDIRPTSTCAALRMPDAATPSR
jgi:hypothetical protein